MNRGGTTPPQPPAGPPPPPSSGGSPGPGGYEYRRRWVTQQPRIPEIVVPVKHPAADEDRQKSEYKGEWRQIGLGRWSGIGKLPTGNNAYAAAYQVAGYGKPNMTLWVKGWIAQVYNPGSIGQRSKYRYDVLTTRADPVTREVSGDSEWFSRTVTARDALATLWPYHDAPEGDFELREAFMHDLGVLMGYDIVDMEVMMTSPAR